MRATHKRFLIFISLPIFWIVITAEILTLPVKAQNTETSGNHLVLLPYDDMSDVNLDKFPIVETRFLLMENGRPSQAILTQDMITLFEGNHAITAIKYDSVKQPVHLTVIIDAESYEDLSEHVAPEPGLGNVPTTKELAKLAGEVNNNDMLQLCFTLGTPSCKSKSGQFNFDKFYFGMRKNADSELAVSLQELLKLAIAEANHKFQTPVIVLLRVPRVDGSIREKFEIPELILTDLAAQGGTLIVLDKEHKPDEQKELAEYFKSIGVYYYPVIGILDDDESCEDFSTCLRQDIENIRAREHVVTYNSRLFQDENPHELMIQVDLNANQDDKPLAVTTEFVFRSAQADSELIPRVRRMNSVLVISAPFLLILTLIFSIDVYQTKE